MVLALAALAAACAQEAPPPGGPVDLTPPSLVGVQPGSLAVGVDPHARIIFEFSEKLDRAGFESALQFAPPREIEDVDFDGLRVSVRTKHPWPADSVMVWTLLPGLKDKHRVPTPSPHSGAFTVGTSIPDGLIGGFATSPGVDFKSVRAQLSVPPPEGSRRATPWRLVAAEEGGRFALSPLDVPAGPFSLEVFSDLNNNGKRDPREPVAHRDSLFLTQEIRILDLGVLPLVDIEAPVESWACLGSPPVDSLTVIVVFRPLGGENARLITQNADSTGCAGPSPLVPGRFEVSAWLDRDGDGRFGPDSTGISEPFHSSIEWEVLPAIPDTLELGALELGLAWTVLDTMRTPPIPRELFAESAP